MKIFSNRTGGFIPALILAVMLVIGVSAQKTYAQYDDQYGSYGDMSYQNFYDELSPYGQWMNDPQYGYVWSPNVGRDFRPYYTNGYWMMTDYGNMWMSNYNWGWAPFHYGRWTLSSYYGWVWIPGNEWGPAWVTWRQGGGNYGWAPMGPGININISFGSGYNVPNPWWTFIPCNNIYSRNFQRYYSPRQTVNIINNTTIINNTYVDARARTTYVTGPRRSDVEAVTRQKVNVYNVSNRSKAGSASVSGRTVNVYRPAVRQTTDRGQTAAPRQVKTLERSVVNTPSVRQSGSNTNNDRVQDRSTQPRNQQGSGSNRGIQQPQTGNSRQVQQSNDSRQRSADQLRSQQQQDQRNQQVQRNAQLQEQQRNQQIQQQQRVQEQQRSQQMQEQQRNQQQQQQRMQEQQRNQQQQQQRMQEQQRSQQMQQQRSQQQQPQRSIQQAQPQRVERSAPVQRSAPATDRSARER